MSLILTAKTPLITLKIGSRGEKTLQIDLIVNNILGIVNSRFLSVYAGVKWLKNLGILVKLWGKSAHLIDKQLLSSYSIILMLLHFLIRKGQINSIMDGRNRNKTSCPFHFEYKRTRSDKIEQFTVFYEFKTDPKKVSELERANYKSILLAFFKYYAV